MARYASGEPMYQCAAKHCKIWFSDKAGIKCAIGSPKTLTHITCPKCKQKNPDGVQSAQKRYEECVYG